MNLPQVVARATSRLLVLLALVAVPSGIYLFAIVTKQESAHTARNLRAVSEVGAQLEDRFDALVQIAKRFPKITTPCNSEEKSCAMSSGQRAKIGQLVESTEWFKKLDGGIEKDPKVCHPTAKEPPISGIVVKIDDDRYVVVTKCEGTQSALFLKVPLRDLINSRRLAEFDAVIVADSKGGVLYSDATPQITVVDIANLVIGTSETGNTGNQAKAGSDPPGGRTQTTFAGRSESWVTAMKIAGAPMRVYGHPYRPSNVVEAGSVPTWYLLGLQSDAAFKAEARVLPFELTIVIAPLIVLAVLAWPLLVIVLSGSGARFGVGVPLSFTLAAVGGAGLLTIITLGLKYHFDVGVLQDRLLDRLASKLVTDFTEEMKQSIDLVKTAQDGGLSRLLPEKSHSIVDAVNACALQKDQQKCSLFGSSEGKGEELLEAAAVFERAFTLDGNGNLAGRLLTLRENATSGDSLQDRPYFQRASKGPLFELWPLPNDAVDADTSKRDLHFAFEQIRSKDFGWVLSAIARPTSLSHCSDSTDKNNDVCVSVVLKRMRTFFAPILPVGVGFVVVRDSEGSTTLDGTAWHTGDVLFHSDKEIGLVNNLLSETADDEGLAIALGKRRSHFLDVDYRGLPHRFYTKPLPVPSWTLVLTAEQKLLRMYMWRNILTSAAAFGSYLLLVAAIVFASWRVERVTPRRSLPSWIRPDADGVLQGSASVALLGIAALLLSGTSAWIEPTAGPFTLWAIALGSACCTFGLLAVHFSPLPSSRTGSVMSFQIENARRSRAGTVTFLIGSLLVASSVVGAGYPAQLWSVALLAAFVALFFARTPRFQPSGSGAQSSGSDARYVLLLLSVLLVVSATPAAMFIRDARSFHQEAYEKHNLGHIASAALERETALRNEARRLQPTQFNRASLADVVVPGDVWCRGFFGFGARALVPACPWTPGVEEPPEQSAKQENALETKIRTATSWFSAAMPFAGNVNALVYSDGWRMSRSDRSITWADLKVDEKVDTGAGSRLRVTAHLTMHPYEFMSGKEGLFDRTHSGDEPKSGDEPEPTFFGALVLGSLMLFVLTWRALAAITATFFGSRNLRRDVATPKSGAHGDWKQCRAEEKLLLRHLADHVIVNGLRNEHVIRNLWSKGLVWFDGSGFRIVDPALESEIRSADHSKAEVEFELANHGDTWSEFRLPFFTALGVAVIAIIVAAPNVLSSVMGVLAASAGGLVAVIQIMNALTRKKS